MRIHIRLKAFLDRGIDWRHCIRQGALGEFYRNGGIELLVSQFDLTVNTRSKGQAFLIKMDVKG